MSNTNDNPPPSGCPVAHGASQPNPKGIKECYYAEYLQLDKLLGAQEMESVKHGKTCHDEHLFIIIHQAYELWFKQIKFDMLSVAELFDSNFVRERDISLALHRLRRCESILKLAVSQVEILNTMTPQSFLEFREFLFPASGFQSYQFREVESLLGLKHEYRVNYTNNAYLTHLRKEEREKVEAAEKMTSLLDLVEKWLERTPFLQGTEGDKFWEQYKAAIERLLDGQVAEIQASTFMSESDKESALANLARTRETYISIFDQKKHDEWASKQPRRVLSLPATQAALLISLYQSEPVLHLPFQLITTLVNIDEAMSQWRHRHALMAARMIGVKSGTGGSNGYYYLRSTEQRHRVFTDLSNLSTYMIPRDALPELPDDFKRLLDFNLNHSGK